MILLCCGQLSSRYFDAMTLFALQLDKRGHQVAIDQRFLPDEFIRQSHYDMAPFLADINDISPSVVAVIGAHEISAEVQSLLSAFAFSGSPAFWALGQFSDLQNELSARNKIAYVTGHEPEVINLKTRHGVGLYESTITPLIAEIGETPVQPSEDKSRILVFVPGEEAQQNHSMVSQISVVNYGINAELHVLTNAKGKNLIQKSHLAELSVFNYSELPPTDLLRYFDALVVYGPNVPGERMAVLALNAMAAGKVVIDCTDASSFAATGAPVLKGPVDATALQAYLTNIVLPNRMEIGQRTQNSEWLGQYDISRLELEMGLDVPSKPRRSRSNETIFIPTNGNGLGHAQRCSLIAQEITDDHTVRFAAFPSCVEMLQSRGFPCVPMVQRSADHADEYAADIINYLRLRSLTKEGDQIVFDGGYVFDSVYRVISELNAPAIWIRRGLWRTKQINPVSLERERAFSKVIVPSEAFAELNVDYSTGSKIHKVGPIVQTDQMSSEEIADLRHKLAVQFKNHAKTLVVTMLGGGVASERTAQTQLLCSMLERRCDCLHLIVTWPNAFVPSALYSWKNSHVVQTYRASTLCKVADLTVSAAGYNSFHELIYGQIPAIFIPQSAPYMDDQERRARAAHERELVGFVQENELLNLEREVTDFLDGGKSETVRQALRKTVLPETGNATAASLIEEGRVQ